MKFKFGNTCFLPVLIAIIIFVMLGPIALLALAFFTSHDAVDRPPEPTLAAMAVPTKSSSGSGIN